MEEKSLGRIESIDLLRGLVMIIMALDHCREFMHHDVMIDQRPLDLDTTYPFLFLTRWITHFCAPVFVFLSGTSIQLYSRNHSKKEVSFFLVSRGLWLMLVEIILIHPLWDFNITVIYLQVIWAIGLSMVFLSLLQFLPYKALLTLGLLIVFAHNLLDGIVVESPFWKSALWSIMHVRHDYFIGHDLLFVVQYPFLPWLGIMILGYVAGQLYGSQVKPAFRIKILRIAGMICVVLFICLRVINVYGDMHQWSTQKTVIFTILDFVKASKYPPSLLFILMTLGPSLIVLSYFEQVSGILQARLLSLGRFPFFIMYSMYS
jgi:uncharacterized membrane protein